MGDAQTGGNDIEIHHGLGDEQRCGCPIKTSVVGEHEAEHTGEAGAEEVVGGEALMLIGGGHQSRARRP